MVCLKREPKHSIGRDAPFRSKYLEYGFQRQNQQLHQGSESSCPILPMRIEFCLERFDAKNVRMLLLRSDVSTIRQDQSDQTRRGKFRIQPRVAAMHVLQDFL